jgi:hypothetical protein
MKFYSLFWTCKGDEFKNEILFPILNVQRRWMVFFPSSYLAFNPILMNNFNNIFWLPYLVRFIFLKPYFKNRTLNLKNQVLMVWIKFLLQPGSPPCDFRRWFFDRCLGTAQVHKEGPSWSKVTYLSLKECCWNLTAAGRSSSSPLLFLFFRTLL